MVRIRVYALVLCLGLLSFAPVALAECFNDFQCPFGTQCVRPAEQFRPTGICAKVEGQERQGLPSPQVHEVKGCFNFHDCGRGYSCVKRDYQSYGVCVK